MKILAKNFISAYNAVNFLCQFSLPLKQAYQLYLLKQEFQNHYNFLESKEKQLFEKYNLTIDENNRINYPSKEDEGNFNKEYNELYQLELDFKDENPIEIDINDLSETMKLSPQDIENLSLFIRFK